MVIILATNGWDFGEFVVAAIVLIVIVLAWSTDGIFTRRRRK